MKIRIPMVNIPTQLRRRLQKFQNRKRRHQEIPPLIECSYLFRYDASLRIGGLGDLQNKIEEITGVKPTKAFRRGDKIGRNGIRKEDLWLLASPLDKSASTNEHLQWLWHQIKPHTEFFQVLIEKAVWADICIGCLSECSYPMLSTSSESLQIVRELKVGISFNFTTL
jgi:hypothetical protein